MKVELLNYTLGGLDLLLRTKGTRLAHDDDPVGWEMSKKLEHLAYMRDTIKSSWAFVDYTFAISDVTRAFTHQLVRSDGEYAQESQRTVDVREHEVIQPQNMPDNLRASWELTVDDMMEGYADLINRGMPVQDARGLLPTNISTSIIAKFNLKELHYMAQTRLCVRTQGEYQDVFRAMRAEVLAVHPWAADFIEVACVANGTCAFPRYGKDHCHIYDPRMDLTQLKSDTKRKFWDLEKQVAIPVAKEGKTM